MLRYAFIYKKCVDITTISGYDFKNAVSEYNGDKGGKVFSTKNLLSVMLYVHMAAK